MVGGLLDYSVYLSPLYTREGDRMRGDQLRQFEDPQKGFMDEFIMLNCNGGLFSKVF